MLYWQAKVKMGGVLKSLGTVAWVPRIRKPSLNIFLIPPIGVQIWIHLGREVIFFIKIFIFSDKKQMERRQALVSVVSRRAIKYSLTHDVLTSFLRGIVMSSTVILYWERRQGFRKASLNSLQNNREQFPEYLIAFSVAALLGHLEQL